MKKIAVGKQFFTVKWVNQLPGIIKAKRLTSCKIRNTHFDQNNIFISFNQGHYKGHRKLVVVEDRLSWYSMGAYVH